MSTPARVRHLGGLALRPDVEPDDDGVGRLGQHTLVSVIAPTPRSMTRRLTSSPMSIVASASSSASTEPAESPLRMSLSSRLTLLQLLEQLVEGLAPGGLGQQRRPAAGDSRLSAIWRAVRSSPDDQEVVAGAGTDVRPRPPGARRSTSCSTSSRRARTRSSASSSRATGRFGRGARGRAVQDRRRRRGLPRVIDRGVGAITETNVSWRRRPTRSSSASTSGRRARRPRWPTAKVWTSGTTR